MLSKKDRRHSGRITPRIVKPMMRWKDIFMQALEPQDFYDDWRNFRDGFRWNKDRSQMRDEQARYARIFEVKKYNQKLKRLWLRRKAMHN